MVLPLIKNNHHVRRYILVAFHMWYIIVMIVLCNQLITCRFATVGCMVDEK